MSVLQAAAPRSDAGHSTSLPSVARPGAQVAGAGVGGSGGAAGPVRVLTHPPSGRPLLCRCGSVGGGSRLRLCTARLGGRLARRRLLRRPLPLGAAPAAEPPACDDDKLLGRRAARSPPGDGAANLTDEQKQLRLKQRQAETEVGERQRRAELYRRQSSERWDQLTGRLRRLIRGELTRLTQRPRLGDPGCGAVTPLAPPQWPVGGAVCRPAIASGRCAVHS